MASASQNLLRNTGIQLNITTRWLGTLMTTLGGLPGHFTSLIMLITNVIMLAIKKTDTLDVDTFDIYICRFITGLFWSMVCDTTVSCQGFYFLSTLLGNFVVVLCRDYETINSDLMKPFGWSLNAPSSSPMTSTHMNYMMKPNHHGSSKPFDKFFLVSINTTSTLLNWTRRSSFLDAKFYRFLGIVIGITAQ